MSKTFAKNSANALSNKSDKIHQETEMDIDSTSSIVEEPHHDHEEKDLDSPSNESNIQLSPVYFPNGKVIMTDLSTQDKETLASIYMLQSMLIKIDSGSIDFKNMEQSELMSRMRENEESVLSMSRQKLLELCRNSCEIIDESVQQSENQLDKPKPDKFSESEVHEMLKAAGIEDPNSVNACLLFFSE